MPSAPPVAERPRLVRAGATPAGFPLAAAARTALDDLQPEFHHRTLRVRPVAASPDEVVAAIRGVSLEDGALARTLLAARTLGRTLRRPRRPLVEAVDQLPGFLLLGGHERELVIGYVGQPWPGGREDRAPRDAAEFRAHRPDDDVKVAMSLRCAGAPYGTLLLTETRILVGPDAARPFGRYWAAARPGSQLVRASLLRAVAARAVAGAGPAADGGG